MFIQTEETPNPHTLKFLPGQVVMLEGTRFFQNSETAAQSPLAMQLLALDGVSAAFFGSDFISVTKSEDISWDILKPSIFSIVMDHFLSGKPVLRKDNSEELRSSESALIQDDPVSQEIYDLLESRVRPAVARDGGDIIFDRFEGGIVYVHLQGACAGCPSSTATLKAGIENMLRHYVPEVEEVRAI